MTSSAVAVAAVEPGEGERDLRTEAGRDGMVRVDGPGQGESKGGECFSGDPGRCDSSLLVDGSAIGPI